MEKIGVVPVPNHMADRDEFTACILLRKNIKKMLST